MSSDEEVLGATPEQQLLLLLSRMRRDGRLLNVTRSYSLHGPVDSDRLRDAILDVARRHDALRTRRRRDRSRLTLLVGDEPDVAWSHRFERPSADARWRRLRELGAEERDLVGDPEGPAVAARLIDLGEDTAYFGVRLNHLVADARSMTIFLREVTSAYGDDGASARATEPPFQFSEHVARHHEWIDGAAARRAAARLAETMHAGRMVVPPPPDEDGGADGVRDVELDDLGPSIGEAARAMRLLPSALYFAACAWTLADLAGHDGATALLVGSVFANRIHPGSQDTVGTFAQLVPVPVHVGPGAGAAQVAASAQRGIATALSYQSYPCQRVPGVASDALASHVFQVVDATEQPFALPAPVRSEEIRSKSGVCRFPFEAVVTLGTTPRLRLVWQGTRVRPSWVDAYHDSFLEKAARLVEAA